MKSRLLCLILPLILLCTACTPAPAEKSPPPDLRTAFLAEADAVTVTVTCVRFTDASGRPPIEIARSPARVAILYASLTTLWYEAGGTAAACIGSPAARELYGEMLGRDITQDDGMTVVSTSAAAKNWSIETILSAEVDLIIAPTAMDGYATVAPAAEAAGIPIIAVDYNDFADYLKYFKIFCHLTGHPERWESVALPALEATLSTIAAIPPGESPTALALFAGSESLSADTPASVLGEMLSLLGAENPVSAPGERVPISLEQIYAADPDTILILCHGSRELAEAQIAASVGQSPVWQSLRAVRENRVHYLDRGLFHNKPNARFADAYVSLAELLYPPA